MNKEIHELNSKAKKYSENIKKVHEEISNDEIIENLRKHK